VTIDPRRTATGEEADLHLGIAPGMDSVLFSGLLSYLAACNAIDEDYIQKHTIDFRDALSRAQAIAPNVSVAALKCDLPESPVRLFFEWFRETEHTVTCYSQGVNQSAQGTDKVNAIINCHLATGRIGRPGLGPFSLTGQPNAMGGREVGGLANQLAAHMTFVPDDIDRVSRFWKAPRMARREGLKAVSMFDAIEERKVKALWVMGTNPAVSLPRAKSVSAALGKLEHFVVSDNVRSNDTINAGAHILLPAAAWGEKDGTVTNSERRVSRQRAFLPLPGEVRPDWWIISEVASRLGFGEAFPYQSPADVFREHAGLSAFENDGSRAFNLSGLESLDTGAYDRLEPLQWPLCNAGGNLSGQPRLFAEGGFFTDNAKARCIAVAHPALANSLKPEFPLRLNTGRLRDQWHTMTRTGLSPRLNEHAAEPRLEVNPEDAEIWSLSDKGFVAVSSEHGRCVLQVSVTDAQQPGAVFAAIHWNGETAPSARIADLVAPVTDPYSGQPEAKATPCAIEPIELRVRGVALSRHAMDFSASPYWTRIRVDGGFLHTFASDESVEGYAKLAARHIDRASDTSDYSDEEVGFYRMAAFEGEALAMCLFAGPASGDLPSFDALKFAFAKERLTRVERIALLSGSGPGAAEAPQGATVCACFGVRLGAIRQAISQGCRDVSAIGARLKAGTNCGSCQPELRRILREELASVA
jgi:assimilatory nitrate reductase catalytic subunit